MNGVGATANFANSYEAAQSMFRGTVGYTDQLWKTSLQGGYLNDYISRLGILASDAQLQKNLKDLDFDLQEDEYKQLALYNETEKSVKNNIIKHQVLDVDSEGKPKYARDNTGNVKRDKDGNPEYSYHTEEISEYEYNRNLLKQNAERIKYENKLKELQSIKDSKNWFEKFGMTALGTGQELVVGAAEGVVQLFGDLYNIVEGLVKYGEGGFKDASGAMEEAFKDRELDLRSIGGYDEWRQDISQWLADSTWLREVDGQATYYGNLIAGIGVSFGRMIPSMLTGNIAGALGANSSIASWISTGVMYTGVAASNMYELCSDELLSSSTAEKLLNATLRATTEMLIEKGLAKALGATGLDALTQGFTQKVGASSGASAAIARFAKDALHEGLEEFLQEYSNYFIDRLFALNNEGYLYTSDWNFEVASTAFLSGVLMSIGGSFLGVLKTSRVETTEVKYDKQGNIVYDKEGNVKYKKLGKLASYEFNVNFADLLNSVNDLVKTSDKSERANIMEGAYGMIRTLSSYFANMSEEVYTRSTELLNIINSEETASLVNAKTFAILYEEMFNDIRAEGIKVSEQELKDNNLRGKTEVYTRNDLDNGTTDEKVLNEVQQIFAKDSKLEKVVLVENGTAAVESDDGTAIIVPKRFANDADGAFQYIVETRLKKSVLKEKRFTQILNKLSSLYETRYNSKGDNAQVLFALLTNADFRMDALCTNTADVLAFVSNLGSILSTITDPQTASLAKQYAEAFEGTLVQYYSNTVYKDFEKLPSTALSEKNKEVIRRNQYPYDYKGEINKGLAKSKNREAIVNSLLIKINAMTVLTADEKATLIKNIKSDDKAANIQAFKVIENYWYSTYNSEYNNKTYFEYAGQPQSMANSFLHHYGIDIPKMLTSGKTFARYNTLFKQYTQGRFEFKLNEDTARPVLIVESDARAEYTMRGTESWGVRDINSTNSYAYTIGTDNVLGNLVEGNADTKRFLTINDIVYDTSLLKENIRKDLEGKSPEQVVQYLTAYYLKESNGTKTIIQDNKGNYIVGDVSSMSDMQTSKADAKLKKIAQDIDSGKEVKLKASALFKTGNKDIDDATIIVKKGDGKADAGYDANTNTITLYVDDATIQTWLNVDTVYRASHDKISTEEASKLAVENKLDVYAQNLKYLIWHEFRHAIQSNNNLASGMTSDFLSYFNKKQQDKIVADMKEHVPEFFKDAKNAVAMANDLLYYSAGGEMQNADIDGVLENKFVPFVTDTENGLTVRTPWGSIYSIDTNGNATVSTIAEITQAKAKKVKVEQQAKRETAIEYIDSFDDFTDSDFTNFFNDIAEALDIYQKAATKEHILTADDMIDTYNKIPAKYRFNESLLKGDLKGAISTLTDLVYKSKATPGSLDSYIDFITECNAMTNSDMYMELVDNLSKGDVGYKDFVDRKADFESANAYTNYILKKYAVDILRGTTDINKLLDKTSLDIKENQKYTTNDIKSMFDEYLSYEDAAGTDTTYLRELGDRVFKAVETLVDKGSYKFSILRRYAAGLTFKTGEVRLSYLYFMDPTVDSLKKAQTILHEALHVSTVYAYFKDVKFRSVVDEVYSEIKDDPLFKDMYGQKDAVEMVAELANPIFVNKLKQRTSIFGRIIEAILKIFGINRGDTLYNGLRKAVNKVLDNPDTKNFYDVAKYSANHDGSAISQGFMLELKAKKADKIVIDGKEYTYKQLEPGKQLTKQEYAKKMQAKRRIKLKEIAPSEIVRANTISYKFAQGTNLEKYVNTKTHKHPYMDYRLQNLIVATTGIESKLDYDFMNLVDSKAFAKEGVWLLLDYVRKHGNMNDTTFQLINKNFFHNNNIKNVAQLRALVNNAGMAYALRGVLKYAASKDKYNTLNVDEIFNRKMSVEEMQDYVNKMKDFAPDLYKMYETAYNNFNRFQKANEEGVVPKHKSYGASHVQEGVLRVSLLENYDGSLFSYGSSAAWANMIEFNPKLGRTTKREVSFDTPVTNSHGDNLTIGDSLASKLTVEDVAFTNATLEEIATSLTDYRIRLDVKKGKYDFYNMTPDEKLAVITKIRKNLLRDPKFAFSKWKELVAAGKLDYDFDTSEPFISQAKVEEDRSHLQRKLYNVATRTIINKMDVKSAKYRRFQEEYASLGFTKDGKWQMPKGEEGRALTQSEVTQLYEDIKAAREELHSGTFDNKYTKADKERIRLLKEKIAKQQRQIKGQKETIYTLKGVKQTVDIQNESITLTADKPMPEQVKSLIDTTFDVISKTNVKNISEDDSFHVKKSYKQFIDSNPWLTSMDSTTATTIVEYLTTALPQFTSIEADTKWKMMLMYTFSYINSLVKTGAINIDYELVKDMQYQYEQVSSAAGQMLNAVRITLANMNPYSIALESALKRTGVDLDRTDLEQITTAMNIYIDADITDKERALTRVQELTDAAYAKALQRAKDSKESKSVIAKLIKFRTMAMLSSPGTWLRNITTNVLVEKTGGAVSAVGNATWNALNKIADKLGGVINKRKLSQMEKPTNEFVGDRESAKQIIHDTTGREYDIITNENKLAAAKEIQADLLKEYDYLEAKMSKTDNPNIETIARRDNLLNASQMIDADIKFYLAAKEYKEAHTKVPLRRTLEGQYSIVDTLKGSKYKLKENKDGTYSIEGIVVSKEVTDFILNEVFNNGLFDQIKDGISKYDTFDTSSSIAGNVTAMIIKGISSKLFYNNQFNTKSLNWLAKSLYKVLSDEKWVNRAFIKYLAATLTEDKVDLSKGVTKEVMGYIADSFVLASADYMHKSSFIGDVELKFRERFGEKAYAMWKFIFPFANASWNWFTEGLRWTPFGLAKSIYDFARFESTVETYDRNYRMGKGVNSRFAAYITKRNIGKGIVGSIGFVVGIIATAFGVCGVEEDKKDKKTKIRIGDVYIDFSDVFGTTGIGMGLILGDAFTNKERFFDAMVDTLDYMFDDSIFSDVYDMVQYKQSFAEVLLDPYKASNILASFIPNLLKTITSSMYIHEVKYDSGFIGTLERIGVSVLPGLAYGMPKQYDPFTGELQYKYTPDFWGAMANIVNRMSSLKVYPRNISALEKEVLSLGLSKGNLTGKYKDIGNLSAEQVGQLNEMYGQLNNKYLLELMRNKVKYTVEDENGNRVELFYRQMSAEQRKSVVNRIMTNNAKMAKVYVWTSNGHKYYTSETFRNELVKNGIRSGVYLVQGKRKGFIN